MGPGEPGGGATLTLDVGGNVQAGENFPNENEGGQRLRHGRRGGERQRIRKSLDHLLRR